jgi:hypothetical protein
LVPDPKLIWRLRVTNPQVARLYALPKIHKPSRKMSPIVSNISAARPPEELYVKNTFEFVDKIKDVHSVLYEILVSFDVEALFPSILVDEALKLFKKWLE